MRRFSASMLQLLHSSESKSPGRICHLCRNLCVQVKAELRMHMPFAPQLLHYDENRIQGAHALCAVGLTFVPIGRTGLHKRFEMKKG